MITRLRNFFCCKKRRFRDAEDGVVAVEFALTAIPFFMLIFGTFEIGQVLWASSQMDFHTDRIVRTAPVDATMTNGQIQSAIELALDDLDAATLTVAVSRTTGTTTTPDILDVQISYTYNPITPFIFAGGFVLNHSSRYPMVDN